MDATIIISFYNKIDWLKLVLAGLKRQSNQNFEVIISDDGSKPEVVQEIKRISSSYPFPVRHNWHEDNGWQKNIILNKSVVEAKSEYLIFIDGDCIPHRHFVREHLNHKTHNTILAGLSSHTYKFKYRSPYTILNCFNF
jgi:glycosyltransferase involved in cell wall biosynthesis